MKVRAVGLVVLTALILAVAFSVSAPAAPNSASTNAVPALALAPNTANTAATEHATHDFGGHRVEAIRATGEAIQQLEICLKYDK